MRYARFTLRTCCFILCIIFIYQQHNVLDLMGVLGGKNIKTKQPVSGTKTHYISCTSNNNNKRKRQPSTNREKKSAQWKYSRTSKGRDARISWSCGREEVQNMGRKPQHEGEGKLRRKKKGILSHTNQTCRIDCFCIVCLRIPDLLIMRENTPNLSHGCSINIIKLVLDLRQNSL